MRFSSWCKRVALFALVQLVLCQAPAAASPPGFDQAAKAYASRNYAQALAQFQSIARAGQADDLTHYYMALCYHMTNQVAAARQEYAYVAQTSRNAALRNQALAGANQLAAYSTRRAYSGQGNTFSASRRSSSGQVKLIDFYTTWCGPCKRLAPVLAELEREYSGRVAFERIDCEAPENAQLVQKFDVHAYPTVVVLDRTGAEYDRIVGAGQKGNYSALIEQALSGSTP